MDKVICLSAGHGAGDPGVVYNGLQESVLTKKIVKQAAGIIRKHGVGCLEVPDDKTLVQTIDWINERPDQIDICVEVHINSGPNDAHGTEGWNYQEGPNESDKLSQFLVDAVSEESGLRNRGVLDETVNRFGKLGFVHDTLPIAALIECGFIQGDYNTLKSEEGITRIAKGVARGCLQYLGIAWRPEVLNPQPAPVPAPPVTDWKALYESAKDANDELSKDYSQLKKEKEDQDKLLEKYKKAVSQSKNLFKEL